jgi:heterodisulfide reductase subunit A
MNATEDTPRIGVFVCHCGHNIAGVVDVAKVAEGAKSLPYVEFSTDEMFMCSDAGQQLIKDKIKEYNLNRVVVASCSPRMHEPTFRRVVEEAGLNRYLFEQVNIREHVSWCHMKQPVQATEKAMDLVKMSVARAANLQKLPIKSVKVIPKTLVIGAGIAGLRAAEDIADRGFDVVLVEKSSLLGGHVAKWSHLYPTGQSGTDLLTPIIRRVKSHPRIEILRNSEVIEFEGFIGNFEATVHNKSDDTKRKINIGTVIVATGFESFKPYGYYRYGEHPDIITLAELQELPPRPELIKLSDGKPVNKLAFIGCVGSREPGLKGHEHCSRHCCFVTAKAASDLIDGLEEVVILYKSLRTYGKHHEAIHRLARQKHAIYSRFPPEEPPQVEVRDGKIMIDWYDILANRRMHFEPDMLVLASAMIAPPDADKTAKLFGLTRSADGFFSPEHIKLAPLTTHVAGVMIAGTSQAAKNAVESSTDASGAAAKAVALMAKGEVEMESTVPQIEPELCSSCYTCVVSCPYGAIMMDDSKEPPIATVTEAKCHGCGTCAAACPSGAITMMHSTNEQIQSMVEALLSRPIESIGGSS